jgi:ferredoxin--NADP+ reductase
MKKCCETNNYHETLTVFDSLNLELENTDVYIDSKQIEEAIKQIEEMDEVEKDLRSNIEAMKAIAEHEKKGVARKLEIKFLSTPIEIKGNGKVEEIVFQRNKVENGKVVPANETFSIKTGLVITAIGYDSIEYSGVTIESGRVSNIAGHVEQNVYAVGWANSNTCFCILLVRKAGKKF